ncbi:unnamed protein product, partial [Staurois parvus]
MTRDCGHSTGDQRLRTQYRRSETADTVQETRDCGHCTGDQRLRTQYRRPETA